MRLPLLTPILTLLFLSPLLNGLALGQPQPNGGAICTAIESTPPDAGDVGPNLEIDVALEHWKSKSKFFIVVTATKSSVPEANLEFSTVNAEFVATKLRQHGYEQLTEPLSAETATKNNFIRALKKINELADNGLVVVYYSGHGVASDHDSELWLQLYGEDLGPSFGLSVTNLISAARGGSYHGELIIVIDSCFSGQGTLNALTPRQLDKTTILTSSSEIQSSRILTLPDGSQSSAFTFYLTEALTNGWANADFDRDGILEHSELLKYLRLRLNCARLQNKIDAPMTPKPFLFSNEQFFAYDQTKVRNWKSPLRQLLITERLTRELATVTQSQTSKPQPSTKALALAKLIPADADAYSRALKLIAEGKASDASSLLSDPTNIINGDLQKLYLASGLAFTYLGRYGEAIESYKKGLRLNKENRDLLDEIASVLALEGKYTEAEKAFERAIAIKTIQLGSQHPQLADTLERYQQVLRKSNQAQKADAIVTEVASIRTKAASPFDRHGPKTFGYYTPETFAAVNFRSGSAVLSPESKAMLDAIAIKALSAKGFMLEVSAFRDTRGSFGGSRALSQRRADAVIRYLVENHNIPLRRIVTPYGYGELNPIADNTMQAARAQNRTVEIKLLTAK
jgi:outer membrane protein OmpA-like peptidoglycan-associated protein